MANYTLARGLTLGNLVNVYMLANGRTLEDLVNVVNNFMRENPLARPLGAPFYADSVWNQMLYRDQS